MRVFLVIAHPEPNQRSFCHRLYTKAQETLTLNKHEVMTLDLYESEFTKLPSLDDYVDSDPNVSLNEHAKKGLYKEEILRHQSCVEWCTHMMLFTPLHWLSPSAALMGWWEKVFGEGWAFASNMTGRNGFMVGKKAMVVVTCGLEQSFYGKDKIHVSVEELMYSLTFSAALCGFTPLRTQAFFGLHTADSKRRTDMINAWGEHVANLESREEIEFILTSEEKKKGGFMETGKITNHKILAQLGDMELMKPKDSFVF